MRDMKEKLSSWVRGHDAYEHHVDTKSIADEIALLEDTLEQERALRQTLRAKLDAANARSRGEVVPHDGMTIGEYAVLACRTSQWQEGHPDFQGPMHRLYCALGFCEEVAEAGGLVKKEVFHTHGENRAKKVLEYGDALWFFVEGLRANDLTFGEVAKANLEKLAKRYPTGAYRHEDSIARRDKEGT